MNKYSVAGQIVHEHPRITGAWGDTKKGGGCNTCGTHEPAMMFHLNSAGVVTRYCPRCLAYLFSQLSQHVRPVGTDA